MVAVVVVVEDDDDDDDDEEYVLSSYCSRTIGLGTKIFTIIWRTNTPTTGGFSGSGSGSGGSLYVETRRIPKARRPR